MIDEKEKDSGLIYALIITFSCMATLTAVVFYSAILVIYGVKTSSDSNAVTNFVAIVLSINVGGVLLVTKGVDAKHMTAFFSLLGVIIGNLM